MVEPDKLADGKAQIVNNLKKSTFKIGFEKIYCATESSDQYAYPIINKS
jgi:hypothetical protein